MSTPSRPRRRTLLAAASAGLLAPTVLRAQGRYPNHSVRVVNAYSPGGTADVVCRILFAALSASAWARPSPSRTSRAPPARWPRRASPARRPTATRCCTTRRRIR